ncbi:mitogen-activated protein kinase kinase kinase 20-like [Miscanthus floridulus]|uniref:mitogen-activated protein kinase kinase kinase 20-like n=1 Tax=Miscanthus floridulus TaxID=154761 RepID=UPI0034589A10
MQKICSDFRVDLSKANIHFTNENVDGICADADPCCGLWWVPTTSQSPTRHAAGRKNRSSVQKDRADLAIHCRYNPATMSLGVDVDGRVARSPATGSLPARARGPRKNGREDEEERPGQRRARGGTGQGDCSSGVSFTNVVAYLHGEESLVHGDVKAANVVVSAEGRAKLADFGCARPAVGCCDGRPVAGSPAFMAPEVARGEEHGPPADVWALACTVIEMATGAAPWSDADDVYVAVHRIAYTDAVPETPAWLSSEAKDFLRVCLQRNPRQRPSAAQVLDHPFLVSAEPAKHGWTWATASPKSTLNVDLWDSDDDDEASESATGRISSLASPRSALPADWDSEDGWIDAHSEECYQPQVSEVAGAGFGRRSDETLDAAEVGLHVVDVDVEDGIRYPTCHVGVVEDFVKCQQRHSSLSVGGGIGLCLRPVACHQGKTVDRNSVVLVITNEKSSLILHKFGHFVTPSLVCIHNILFECKDVHCSKILFGERSLS